MSTEVMFEGLTTRRKGVNTKIIRGP